MKHYFKQIMSLLLLIVFITALTFISTTRVSNEIEAGTHHNYSNEEALKIIADKLSKVDLEDTEITEETEEETKQEVEEVVIEVDENDLDILARLIMGECGNSSYEMKHLVGCVVVNRVNSNWFPNTYYEVAHQDGQYACVWLGGYYQEPDDECYEVARELLINGVDIPDNVVWQAEFIQGEIYRQVDNEYFCYK